MHEDCDGRLLAIRYACSVSLLLLLLLLSFSFSLSCSVFCFLLFLFFLWLDVGWIVFYFIFDRKVERVKMGR